MLIDRYIIKRFVLNFVILFVLLFTFAITVDLILQLDRFVDAARSIAGDEARSWQVIGAFVGLLLDFHGPRVFQFYAYLMGMVCIGAMGFTLAQMHRNRELVAVMASGVSLHRLAMPFLVIATLLNGLQLLNQEYILPRLAPQLIRKHSDIGRPSIEAFKVNFTRDNQGTLFHAASFDPETETLNGLTLHIRDEQGRTVQRASADRAVWDQGRGGWLLENGYAVSPIYPDVGSALPRSPDDAAPQPVDFIASSLTPEVLTMRRYRQYSSMLSVRQIDNMLAIMAAEGGFSGAGVTDAPDLVRHKFSRFAMIFVNLLAFYICLPFFLLREPANLLRQSLLCAGVAIPIMLGALLSMMAPLRGIPPVAGVFIPVIALVPIALARFAAVKT